MSGKSDALRAWELANPPVEPEAWMPHYVHACHNDAWFIQYRHILGKLAGVSLPFRCGSRHHKGPCRGFWQYKLRERLTDPVCALKLAEPEAVMFWTLTFDRFMRGPDGMDADRKDFYARKANAELGHMWRRFMGRLNKMLRRLGLPCLQYFWVREAHRDGFPHLHLAVVSRYLADLLRVRDDELLGHDEIDENDRTLAPMWMRELAKDCGFGMRFDAQIAKNRDSIAGYVTKVTGSISDAEIDATNERMAGEFAKAQGELKPPRHCRVYGYSKGFLPPKPESDWTGWIENKPVVVECKGKARGKIYNRDGCLIAEEIKGKPLITYSEMGVPITLGHGMRLGMHAYTYEDAEKNFHAEHERRKKEAWRMNRIKELKAKMETDASELAILEAREEGQAVYDSDNALASIDSIDEAHEYVIGDLGSSVVKTYTLKKDLMYTPNETVAAERRQMREDMGVDPDEQGRLENRAYAAAVPLLEEIARRGDEVKIYKDRQRHKRRVQPVAQGLPGTWAKDAPVNTERFSEGRASDMPDFWNDDDGPEPDDRWEY